MTQRLMSMTGFGRASHIDGKISVEIEIRSVNNRFLKIQSRIPERLSPFQAELEALVRKAIRRGSVSMTIRAEFPAVENACRIDADVLKRYHDMIEGAKKKFGLAGEISIDTLVGLPGVLDSGRDVSPSDRALWKKLQKPAREALRDLIQMRSTEGCEIARDIAERVKRIKVLVTGIKGRAPLATQAYGRRLRERVKTLLDGTGESLERGDLAREIALVADRADISEEIQRTQSHLKQIATCIRKESEGRRLEFLVQELFREASTMAAKNIDEPSSGMILDLRAEIDKIKEQAQNIE